MHIMSKNAIFTILLFVCQSAFARAIDDSFGQLLPASNAQAALWWASSGWKVSPDKPLPGKKGKTFTIRTARNEAEAAQLIVRPTKNITGFFATASDLRGSEGGIISVANIDILRVRFVNVTIPTDSSAATGLWPDPLPPFKQPIDLEANKNQPLWIRVNTPRNVPAGIYTGNIKLTAKDYTADVAINVEVYAFALPDKMTCTTAFGFSASNVFRYHKLTDETQKRQVLDKYWETFSRHHISPYNPAPLDAIAVSWPAIKPPAVDNEKPVRTELLLPAEQLGPKLDFTAWDRAMSRAIDHYQFNSFRLKIPGIGGGTYHAISQPNLLGFTEKDPEYPIMFDSYCRSLQEHFEEKGWTDEAYVYWFDEPSPSQYEFVMNGFAKLKKSCPKIARMLTEQPEPALNGGPNIYCAISYLYDHKKAQQRREHGDRFWWYVCTGPKAPYCTLFIDHPATELRVWLWQTWKRNIEGILVWQTNYWTSDVAYPNEPQNPYEDPMGWVSGYSTPIGKKMPWGNGDGRFIYPPESAAAANSDKPILDGPVDSIRWEMLRDGIEDYEYHVILKKLLKNDKLTEHEKKQYHQLLEVPQTITKDMKNFTKDPAPIELHRDKIARAIEKLSKYQD